MKINIKPLLTGTTLFVASVSNIDAVPPKGIKLIEGATVTHPVFGKIKVISHREDLEYYNGKIKDLIKKDPFLSKRNKVELLTQNFITYVLNADSLEQANIPQKDIGKFVKETCYSQAGMAALEVITANYMREYDRIKRFCKDHPTELEACYNFSQTEEGKKLCEKERQVFELEEKLKDLLWGIPSEKLESYFSKSGISSDDLKNLYEYFKNEEKMFNDELKGSWTRLLEEDPGEDFFIGEKEDYEPFCALYKHFLDKKGNDSNDDDDLVIHCRDIEGNSEKYQKLRDFVFKHKTGFEKFFNIGSLCVAENSVERGSVTEWHCRNWYFKHEGDLERLSRFRQEEAELLRTAKSTAKSGNLIASRGELEKLYKEETKDANEKKFSCIRRSVIPACYFPILYRHFFVENASEYSDIEKVNKFLYRTLKFKKDSRADCCFDWRTLTIIGNFDKETSVDNYHINSQGKLSDFAYKNCETPLQHELVHFMDAVNDLNRLKVCEKISEELAGIIKAVSTVCELEIPNVKPEKNYSDSEEEESEEEGDCDDRRVQVVKPFELLRKLYDNGGEMWAMYGILFIPGVRSEDNKSSDDSDDEDSKIIKGEFYYDPINEAVMNAEAMQVVRTGHCRFKNGDHIDSNDEESPSEIKVLKTLNDEIGVYSFYFNEGEKLRELTGK